LLPCAPAGRFSIERAQRSEAWLQELREGKAHTPETLEYGIGSWTYRSRRPFQPERLHAFLSKHFVVQEPDWSEEMAEDGEGGDAGVDHDRGGSSNMKGG
jgi:hypothetical protein